MGKNRVLKRLTGSGTFTVPAGVTNIKLYKDFKGIQSLAGGMARTFNDQIWAWGSNASGRFGNNSTASDSTPIIAMGSDSFRKIHSSGLGMASSGITDDGSLYMTGLNSFGQLGDGTTTSKSTPTLVSGGHKFIKCENINTNVGSAGNSAALKANGEVWTWGHANFGQLGNGNWGSNSESTPVQVLGGHSFVDISIDGISMFGLKANGEVWAWGGNFGGDLGNNATSNQSTPVQVLGGHSFVKLSKGCALKANGEVWAWGGNGFGQLGNGTTDSESTPVQVLGGHSFVDIYSSEGRETKFGLKANGEVWAWGKNGGGQLGNNATDDESTPVQVLGGHSFVEISSIVSDFSSFNCSAFGLKANGEVWAWGKNGGGQLGNNATDDESTPVQVVTNNVFTNKIPFNPVTSLLVSQGQEIGYDLPNNFGDIIVNSGVIHLEYFA